MGLPELNQTERDTIQRCVVAILRGAFIDDSEFQTRLGVDRPTLSAILAAQPHLDDCAKDSTVQVTINNCMNEIVNGVNISSDDWDKWFVVSRQEVQTTFKKWSALNS